MNMVATSVLLTLLLGILAFSCPEQAFACDRNYPVLSAEPIPPDEERIEVLIKGSVADTVFNHINIEVRQYKYNGAIGEGKSSDYIGCYSSESGHECLMYIDQNGDVRAH